jgi:hypothetical protein
MNLFERRPLIEQIVAKSPAWQILRRDGDMHRITSADSGSLTPIVVRAPKQRPFVVFNAFLPIRFSLERTPQGLFARLLFRSNALGLSSWNMDIAESCEALPYLFAQVPRDSLTPFLFDLICREMTEEIRSFRQELRDRFSYGIGPVGGGVHQPSAEVQYIEPVQEHGPQRYRLPKG